ncbi:glycosyltransferase [Roseibacillus ishigakijimensis]|uniref:Glycosyltransferase n=1 Tax=Roseibacillus ishigakijimensis TaxID=454146 RepID=A0A934RV35_9BACT|nr:glycosyltransferase [Roseibacillus ishigakijimensis]MBK1835554.1 glycosyltransferase [Roseibacillus ishigakijimensis]
MLSLAPLIALLLGPSLWLILGRPRFLSPPPRSAKEGRISIIIPARNEEHRLGRLLSSLAENQHPPHEILVVDDESTDGTARVAGDLGATVISTPPRPAEWQGKPWACETGARAATGDWLLFLDADTWFEPGGFDKISHLTGDDRSVSSLCPHHCPGSAIEELSAFFNLVMVAGSNAFRLRPSAQSESALFGQSLLISRALYQEAEGHHSVRNQVLENFHLAGLIREKGGHCQVFLGRGVLAMRMFDQGLGQIWNSWKKGFTTGAKQTNRQALLLISLWLTGAMTILVSLPFALFYPHADPAFVPLLAAGYLFYAAQCGWAFRLVGRFSPLTALLFPIALTFYQVLFFTALRDQKKGKTTPWKGRDVH